MRPSKDAAKSQPIESYNYPAAQTPLRPDAGVQAQWKKKKAPQTYRYDPSLAPELSWDGQNAAREAGEALIRRIIEAESLEEAQAAAEKLKELSRPFLNWAGKAERLSFDVPTLPLFVHERLSTEAIIQTLRGHKRSDQLSMLDLYGDPRRPVADQVLRPYEFGDWTNRLVLGDSLVVMNSLLHYESLGGKVQMIYIDPPYGVKFGSNFQPFVRKRDVSSGDDDDMTREPEMVQAYRDTWELGLHSYLTYLRDRLLLARDLLHPSGSVFVQISDDNLHHVREVMDEVFGGENFVCVISVQKTGGLSQSVLPVTADFLLWYAKDRSRLKFNPLYLPKSQGEGSGYQYVELSNGQRRRMSPEERDDLTILPVGSRIFQPTSLESANPTFEFEYCGKKYIQRWKTNRAGLARLAQANRLYQSAKTLRYVRYVDDFPVVSLTNVWTDTGAGSFLEAQLYVVQTVTKIVARCVLMTTDPGDLVLDPTCGSGTTAYVAEQWGRRWITIDTSRVPLALTRQRLLTATFPYYELKDPAQGPSGGFVYKRKQNKKGEEVGGIVPHITLKSIANNEPPAEEVLVDRPEVEKGVTRVSGPFAVEATIPTPVDWDADGTEDSGSADAQNYGSYVERMLEVLRKSPVLRLNDNKTIAFKSVRPPARSLSLSAEAMVENGEAKPVAFVFGPENGAISENTVFQAAREAYAKSYTHLYVIGFAIQPNARKLVEDCAAMVGVPATYVQATPDLLMGDLLKNMRSSQIFSVAGLPEVLLQTTKDKEYQVELAGLDIFDPVTMETEHRRGNDVPAWFLDSDYNGLCFHVTQAFFPRTAAWDNLKKALKSEFNESAWEHLSGTRSTTFPAGEHGQIAVKVIDDRGNELMVVKRLEEAR